MEDFTKQNEEMFKSIEQTTFGKTDFTISEPAKYEYTVTETKQVTENMDQGKNIAILQEAEARHQSQVDGLYS